jgi:hypothetical protein
MTEVHRAVTEHDTENPTENDARSRGAAASGYTT